MRQPLVAGNWKMNGSRAGVVDLLDGIKAGMGDVNTAEVAVCPPFVFIPEAAARLQGTAVAWGGQNLSTHGSGAYTGEVAASMLTDFGCKYVIVGHSERRAFYGERRRGRRREVRGRRARRAGADLLCRRDPRGARGG